MFEEAIRQMEEADKRDSEEWLEFKEKLEDQSRRHWKATMEGIAKKKERDKIKTSAT